MTRVAPAVFDDLPETTQAVLREGESLMGFMPNDALVMAHRPALLLAFLGLVRAAYGDGPVSSDLKRLIGLVASREAQCGYCVAHTVHGAQRLGVPLDKLNALCDFEHSDRFTPAEKAALTVAAAAARVPNAVTDQQMATLREHYDAAAQVDILGVIGLFGFLNRWNATLRTSVESAPAAALAQQDHTLAP
ncbi:MAG: carboxymuconolactone decarboxylase family protein [Pseudomonadota bacterium]